MIHRPRRNRKSAAVRGLVQETAVSVSDLIFPLFLTEGKNTSTEIKSMPGIYRFTVDNLLKEIDACMNLGIHSFALFPNIAEALKDKYAVESYNEKGLYLKAIREIKKEFPESCIISDVAMDPYSSDGHDGIVENGEILNDETLDVLGQMALAQAQAGSDIVAPSDMMDGRVGFIRDILDDSGFTKVSIMAYTAKYASAFYGPFREALESAPKFGDKKTYQMDPANQREALIEAELDYSEGADFLMVVYLRVASQAAKQFNVILLTDAEALKFENKKLILLVSQLSCSAILIIWVFLQISVTREITFLAVLICVSLFVLSRLNLHGTFVTQNSGSLQFFLQVNLYVFCMLIISMHWMIRIGFQEVTFTLKRKKELIYLSLLGILAASLLISFNRYFVFLICIVLVAILTGLHAYDLVAFVVSRKLKWMDVKVHTLSCFINFFFVLCPALYYTFPQSLSIEFDIPGYRSYFFPVIGFAIMLALGENHKKRTTNVLLALMKANTTAEIEAEKRVTQQIFLSMLLHEIKTPLSVIRFGADAFKRMATGIGDQTVWANRVEMATQSIDKILEKCTAQQLRSLTMKSMPKWRWRKTF